MDREYKNEQPLPVVGDDNRTLSTRRLRSFGPTLTVSGVTTASDSRLAMSSFIDTSEGKPRQSDSTEERRKGARFNTKVDIVYYDSKQHHTGGAPEGNGCLDIELRLQGGPQEAEHSFFGSSEDWDEHVPYMASRLSSNLEGDQTFLDRKRHRAGNEDGATKFQMSISDVGPKEEPARVSRFLPRWTKTLFAYISVINDDSSLGAKYALHKRFKSFAPLTFKQGLTEAEFVDLDSRGMQFQVAMGSLFLIFFFTVHFVTLYNSMLSLMGIVIGEFVISALLVLAMVIFCFGCCFRRIRELAVTIIIGLLFSFRASVRVAITAKSINVDYLGKLGLFTYSMMGFAETMLLLIIPYHLASIRYAFCFWLTVLIAVWTFPIVGLSAKVAIDLYKEKEEGYWFWAPMVYAMMGTLAFALDQSCLMHEYARRIGFWKRKTAVDRLDSLENRAFSKEEKSSSFVPATPMENVISNLDHIQAVLYDSKMIDKERERLQELLNEARHNLTFTDNVYRFNAETCSSEFAKSYYMDYMRREGILKPRILPRKTTLAVRRKSRSSGFTDAILLRANMSDVGTNWNFDCIAFGRISQKPIYDVGYTILSPFCLSPDVSMNREVLCNFLQEVSSEYMDNPYHNALHGATVCHMTLCLLEMLSIREYMNDLEDISAGIASLCHDVGHPGRNNNFMIAASTPLAITYNDGSVLENHHSSLTFRILNKPNCNILEKVAPDAYKIIRKNVIEWILGTDMKMHFEHISSFRTQRMNGEFSLAKNEDRSRMISMCIKAADIGHAATVWEQHEEWCRRVVEEFYEQGDEEMALGLPKSFMCDRSLHEKEFLQSQIGFITFVVRPLYEELKCVDNMLRLSAEQEIERVCIANLEANATRWQNKEKGLPD